MPCRDPLQHLCKRTVLLATYSAFADPRRRVPSMLSRARANRSALASGESFLEATTCCSSASMLAISTTAAETSTLLIAASAAAGPTPARASAAAIEAGNEQADQVSSDISIQQTCINYQYDQLARSMIGANGCIHQRDRVELIYSEWKSFNGSMCWWWGRHHTHALKTGRAYTRNVVLT